MTEILIALISAALAGALGWFIAQSRSAAVTERAKLLAADLEVARAKLAELSALNSQLSANLASERATAAAQISALTDAHERLTNSFKALSADALRSNNTSFLEIARDVLSRIFEPYFTTKEQTGTGLGLAIVCRLVKHHHGLTQVKTKLGEGTRFTIYLPAKEPSASGDPFHALPASNKIS